VSRAHLQVQIPPLALRRAEAAAACGVSVEVFDQAVRPYVPAKRLGGVVVYPVDALITFLADATSICEDLNGKQAA
jgi:hypothetical protein